MADETLLASTPESGALVDHVEKTSHSGTGIPRCSSGPQIWTTNIEHKSGNSLGTRHALRISALSGVGTPVTGVESVLGWFVGG